VCRGKLMLELGNRVPKTRWPGFSVLKAWTAWASGPGQPAAAQGQKVVWACATVTVHVLETNKVYLALGCRNLAQETVNRWVLCVEG
jgi:hypothetical protein